MTKRDKVRFAVVGLGWFGQTAVLPGFTHVKNAELRALVSGDAEKRHELSGKYGVPALPYEEYDTLLRSGDIDAVYLVLPNSMHADYTVRAAAAGVAVLCEKPLAPTAAECRRMIDACAKAGVPLMTAYRLHFDPCNLAAIDAVQSGKIGEPRLFTSLNLQQVEAGNTRLDASLGGHPLLDVGIYSINAARYLFRDEPTEASAFVASRPEPRYAEVPEMVGAMLRFPKDRLAHLTCGFGQAKASSFQLVGTEGDVRADPGFAFTGTLQLHVTVGEERTTTKYPVRDQVGGEIEYFAHCLQQGKRPEPDGEEGLADVAIIEGLLRSVKEGGKPVRLTPLPRRERPDLGQRMQVTKSSEPTLVNASAPGGK